MASTVPPGEDLLPAPGYSFEPEFTGHPPRPIPDRLLDGPYARSQRTGAIVAAAAGLAALLLSGAPGIERLGLYVLPLRYLPWVGLGLLLLAAVGYARYALRRGPYEYVREGMPLAARVIDLVKTPTQIVNGAPSMHAFVALVTFRHPETGAPTQAQVKSSEFSSARKDAYEATFKVGDTVTAVYLPGRLEKTLRLHAFLELSPDVHLHASVPSTDSPLKLVLLVMAIPAIFVVLFANVYAHGRYLPIGFEMRQAVVPLVVGGLILGGGLFAGLFLGHRSEQKRIQERATAAAAAGKAVEVGTPFLGHGAYGWVMRAVMAVGAPLVGALTALCWCFMANAWLDRAPAAPIPATIVGMTARTHALLLREYQLEYTLAGSSERLEMLTTPEHLRSLRGPSARAYVRPGRLGWPWVETVTSE